MIVSKNGYIIVEIYKDLKKAMMNHDFERVCNWSCELVCSGEIKNLINWIVGLCCNEYISTNSYIIKFCLSKIQTVSQAKYRWKNKVVKEAICEILMILSKEESTSSLFYKIGANYQTYIDIIYHNRARQFRELQENMGFIIHNEMFVLFCYLYEFMLKNDAKAVCKIVHYIAHKANINECETLDIVRDIPKNKTDPVWALWKTLFIYLERPPINKNVDVYVKSAFELFKFEYTKKRKQERLNLIFVCFIISVRRKQINCNETYDYIVSQAVKQIEAFYDDILKNEKRTTEKKGEDKKVIPERKKEKKSSLTYEQLNAIEKKTKYLFALTYHDTNKGQGPSSLTTSVFDRPYKLLDVDGVDDMFINQSQNNNRFQIEKL